MEFASCHVSSAENFELAPTFLENLCTPATGSNRKGDVTLGIRDMGGACGTRGREESCEGKRPRGRPKRRWEDNIKMVLKEKDGRL